MAGEEKSGGLDEGESGTLAVSVGKAGDDEIFKGDGSVSGGTEELLTGGDGCVWGGKGTASVDEGDCGRGDGTSVLDMMS